MCEYYYGWLNQNHSMNSSKLTADDIPGASLDDREPEKFKITELKTKIEVKN